MLQCECGSLKFHLLENSWIMCAECSRVAHDRVTEPVHRTPS